MDIKNRIAQFENMAQADPTNEMAHFSLAKAYADAGRFDDAAASYVRCTELVPDMSKAYQMAGEAFIKAGNTDRAAAILTTGYEAAAARGDRVPQKAIGDLLTSLGKPLPAVAARPASPAASGAVSLGVESKPDANAPVPEGMIRDHVSGRIGTRMTRPPFRGPIGQWIAEHVSQEQFKAWISQGTKVINELRLDLSREKDQEIYDQHMHEFLGLDQETLAQLGVKKQTA